MESQYEIEMNKCLTRLDSIEGEAMLNEETKEEEEHNSDTQFIYSFEADMANIIFFDMANNHQYKKSLTNKVSKLCDFGSICVNNKIIIIGGYSLSSLNMVNTAYEFHPSNCILEQKASMKFNRSEHSLGKAYLNGANLIYSIGGLNNGLLDVCEKYNLEEDIWSSAPSLAEKVKKGSATTLNRRFIYLIGGISGSSYYCGSTKIERLDCKDERKGWICIEYTQNSSIKWLGGSSICSINISPNSILFFGGTNQLKPQSKSFLIKITNNYTNHQNGNSNDHFDDYDDCEGSLECCMSFQGMMSQTEIFNINKACLFQEKVYVFGEKNRNIHVFHIRNKTWTTTASLQPRNTNPVQRHINQMGLGTISAIGCGICSICVIAVILVVCILYFSYVLADKYIF
jgi:hypothetical protein